MTTCIICGRDDGHHHDHDESFVCARCYPAIVPLVQGQVDRLRREHIAAMQEQRAKTPEVEQKIYAVPIDTPNDGVTW